MSSADLYFGFCAVVCGFGSLYGWWRALRSEADRGFILWLVVGIVYGLLAAVSVNIAVGWTGA